MQNCMWLFHYFPVLKHLSNFTRSASAGVSFQSTACSIIKKQTPAQILYNNHFKTTQDRYIFFRRSLSDCFGRMSMYWILPFVQIPKLNKMTGVYTSLANNKSKQLGHPEILKRPEHLSI